MGIVTIENIKAGMVLAEDIFPVEGGLTPIVQKKTRISERILARLKEHGIKQATIVGVEEEALMIRRPQPIIHPKLQREAVKHLEALFSMARADSGRGTRAIAAIQVVKELDTVVEKMVDAISRDEGALVNIADLKSRDDYTYHHSLSVAVLAIAIGQNMGFAGQELNLLGRSAMLHDIGKAAIPLAILNKPARLDAEEFAIVKQHAAAGYTYLLKSQIGDEALWQSVLYHHERVDGTGYPYGLTGKKIPLLARIISVADVYDALTSYRPYRSPMQPGEAIEYIMAGAGTSFDYDIVSAFMRKLELYPPGAFVELSDGRTAVVLDSAHALWPVVQLVGTCEILDLYADRRNLSLTIRRVLERCDPFQEDRGT